MGPSRPKRTPFSEPPSAPEDPSLVTSEELFGDLVDEATPGEDTKRKANRSRPIRVRVKEQEGAAGPDGGRDVLPPDVAALLDAFSGPAEEAARTESAKETGNAVLGALSCLSGGPAPDPLPILEPRQPETPVIDETLGSEGEEAGSPEISALLGEEEPPPVPTGHGAEHLLEGSLDARAEDTGRAPGAGEWDPEPGGGLLDPADLVPEEFAHPRPRNRPEAVRRGHGAPLNPADLLQGDEMTPPVEAASPPHDPGFLDPAQLLEEMPEPQGDLLDPAELVSEPLAPPPAAPAGDMDDLLGDLSLPEPDSMAPVTPVTAATPPAVPDAGALDLAALAEDAFATSSPAPVERDYGPYRLLEKVAVGGMAEVFRAKRAGVEGFEKVVAVKRILAHLSDNKEFVDMFINEAKMVAGLTHPNIVQIFDLGKIDKSYYIAMEYVHGKDLRTIQKRAKDRGVRIPMDISALIVSKICLALGYAHRKKDEAGRAMKIVHRDVSPQNVLISFEGEVKLTDFGIAKAATKAPTTDAGALRGKLLYMSPEQAWGRPIDRRSDIFSLGIILYELVCEQKPFQGSSDVSILELVRECKVAPPRTLNPRIPDKLEHVVMKALAREPDERYQEAEEMARNLERALPDGRSPGGAELVRFMEILFESEQRGKTPLPEQAPLSESLDIEFDEPTAKNPPSKTAPGADPLSIDKLLSRFGIK
jgi:serine/threonine protein kinase